MFERALQEAVRLHGYDAAYLSRLVRTPASDLDDQARWVQLLAVQASLEYMARHRLPR